MKLTISIPTWNRLNYLRENVLSIVNAFKAIPAGMVELFVTDNASDDGTEEFLSDLANTYDFVRYHRHSENKGANVNFYTALKEAKGEYVWLLGDDDIIVEDSIKTILHDLDAYKPAVLIGGTENDASKKRVYLPRIKEHLLTNQAIFSSYDAIQLAGKMSVLIFSTEALTHVLDSGWALIQATKTPWPHLIWFLKIMAQGQPLLIVPYATNCNVEKNKYNCLQNGVLRLDLLFTDYANLVQLLRPEFDQTTQQVLISHITKGRIDELVKILAYSTYLNKYNETLQGAMTALKILPSWRNKLALLTFYAIPALLPIKLRYALFNLPCKLSVPLRAYRDFIVYLQTVQTIQSTVGGRAVFDKNEL